MNPLAFLATLLTLAAAADARDEKESLAQACAKAAALESYTFKGETEIQSAFGNAPGQIPSFDGTYQKDVGLHIKSERGELFRQGDRILIKQGEEAWKDISQLRPPTPTPAPGDRPNRNRGGMGMFGPMIARGFKAPHDELKDLARGFKEVKRQEKTDKIDDVDCVQYYGELNEEAMKNSPFGRRFGQLGGANASLSGSAKIWVDGSGNVVIYEVVTKATLDFQGNTVDLTVTRRSEISNAGKAKLQTPDAVLKLLADKPSVTTGEKKEDK